MDRFDYIESIILHIRGITGVNYQMQIKEILKVYYQYNNKTYDMPDFYGGDDKNDGWVVEDALFYQVFAPTRLKDSLKKEIQDKFKEDLDGLLNHIYINGKWRGKLEQFIFIVNTFDCNLPHDSEGFFDYTVEALKTKYQADFTYRIVNSDYFRVILSEITDIDVLRRISSILHIKNLIDYNAITETAVIDLIGEISGNINVRFFGGSAQESYERVSTKKKISINDLDDKKDHIEKVISMLDVVQKAVNSINQDVLFENKFERVKEFIIAKYNELRVENQGVQLYDNLVDELLKYTNNKASVQIPLEFLIVYIFDKCDIFEKE